MLIKVCLICVINIKIPGNNLSRFISDVVICRTAYRIIFLLGIVALCGDFIYERARSISGSYPLSFGVSVRLTVKNCSNSM